MPPDREPNLDDELRDLGPRIEYPPTPDLAGSVEDRLDAEGGAPPRPGPSLWWLAAAALVILTVIPVLSFAVGGGMGGMAGGAGGGEVSPNEQAAGAPERGDGPTTAAAGAAQAGSTGDSEKAPAMAASASAAAGAEAGEGIVGGARPNDRPVPDVVGMKVLVACGTLSSRDYAGYVVRATKGVGMGPPGRVLSQKPKAGRVGVAGEPVDLTVSRPYPEALLKGDDLASKRGCVDVTQ